MKKFITMTLAFLLAVPVASQVGGSFEARKTQWGDHPLGGNRPFYAKFEFREVPRSFDTAVADFELVVCQEDFLEQRKVWPIRVAYSPATTTLLSDSVIYWRGGHELGTTLTGTIRFIPLTSGIASIAFFWQPVDSILDNFIYLVNGVSFEWCLNDDGELEYLGCSEGKPVDCAGSGAYFFKNDQFRIRSTRVETERYPFDYEISNEGPLLVGDTGTVLFNLKVLHDLPKGVDIDLVGESCELLSSEANLRTALAKGDSVHLRVSFIPRPVRDDHGISVIVQDLGVFQDSGYRHQTIRFGFSFNDAGRLRYVGTGQWSAPASALPRSYPWADSVANNTEMKVGTSRK
ncbi:MAG: hypothetical protein AB1644_06430 [Candidatus Zixiibacteriota bacterium]